MISGVRKLSQAEIHQLFEMLGMASEDQRQRILKQIFFSQQTKDAPIRIKGDNITTPYQNVIISE
jgi:hypothetical protein